MSSDEEDDFQGWEKLETIKTFDVSDGIGSSKTFQNASRIHESSTKLMDDTPSLKGNFIESITTKATAPVSLLIESLVQQLCSMLDPDPTGSAQLYNTICMQLHSMNLIDETYLMSEFDLMRSQYQRALYQLVMVARGQRELPLTLQSVLPVPENIGMSWSRYHREFDEISFIAGGGFGRVYRARHKLDGIEYAVKKITIKYTTINRVLSHLAEVKTFASLNHTNIVPYKNAWLEPLFNSGSNNCLEGDRRKKEKIKPSIVPVKNGVNSKITDQAVALFHSESDDEDDEYDDDDDMDADDENFESVVNDDETSNFDFNVQNKRLMSKQSAKIFQRIETKNDESSDFIEFQRNESKVSIEDISESTNLSNGDLLSKRAHHKGEDDRALCKKPHFPQHNSNNYNNLKSDLSFDESQPHLKLKWATLYIQMAFRSLTLRSWLDERNKHTDFNEFYKNFLRKSILENQSANEASTNDSKIEVGIDEKYVQNQQNRLSTHRKSNSAFEECLTREYKSYDVAIDIFTQVLNGLNYIHLQNIVHHDIKPSNIFIGCEKNGKLYVQLGDFGLACPLQAKHSPDGIIGTLTYAAPEQLAGHCNPKSDLFSLGIIMLELLIPFTTDMERVQTIEKARKGILPKEIPQRYVSLLRMLLQHHKKRPDTIQLSDILSKLQSTNENGCENSDSSNEPQQNDLRKQLNQLTTELNTLKLQLSTTPPKYSEAEASTVTLTVAQESVTDLAEIIECCKPEVKTSQQQSNNSKKNSVNKIKSAAVAATAAVHNCAEKNVLKHCKKELLKQELEIKLNVNEIGDKDKLIALLQEKLTAMSKKENELSQEVERLREKLNELENSDLSSS